MCWKVTEADFENEAEISRERQSVPYAICFPW